jgi:intergrase/recombinase
MGKKVNRDREKILSKADIKANNILKAVEAHEAEDSDLLMRRAAALFHCSPASISNHINARKDVQYLPDLAVEYQKLTPIEEAVLKDHIHDCFQSGLSLSPKLLREYVNELCRAKGDFEEVGKNWHLGFYERHTSVESIYARSMAKERVANEDVDNYIAWFRLYESTVAKWNILSADTHNMDESGCAIGVSHKSRVIIPAKEKEAIKSMDGKREWATNIDTISSIGIVSKGFFVTKGKNVLTRR